ncbi:hypothetical protein HYQ46_001562 [Verticillium longisporum]|nr:hypothetical protein HYQ46_001562 [Verticillium longisporum]
MVGGEGCRLTKNDEPKLGWDGLPFLGNLFPSRLALDISQSLDRLVVLGITRKNGTKTEGPGDPDRGDRRKPRGPTKVDKNEKKIRSA